MLKINSAIPPSLIWLHCPQINIWHYSNWTSPGWTADIREERVQVPAAVPNPISHLSVPPYKYSSNKPKSIGPQMRLPTRFDSLTLTSSYHLTQNTAVLTNCYVANSVTGISACLLLGNRLMCLRAWTDPLVGPKGWKWAGDLAQDNIKKDLEEM